MEHTVGRAVALVVAAIAVVAVIVWRIRADARTTRDMDDEGAMRQRSG